MSRPRDNKFLDILAAVVDSLRETRVRYMIIGAWALAVWGRPRATMDLDFMVMVDERGLARLEKHLIRQSFSVDDAWLEANPMLKNAMRRMWFRGVTVDLMRPRDIQDEQALARRKKKRLQGRFCWFVAPEDFILQKLKTGRPRDIEDALSALARSRKLLDFKYLDRWAARLDLTSELKYVLGE